MRWVGVLGLALSLACGGTFASPTYCKGNPTVPLADGWDWLPIGADAHVCASDATHLAVDYSDPGGDPLRSGDVFFRYSDWLKVQGWEATAFSEEGNDLGLYRASYQKDGVQLDVSVFPNDAFDVAALEIERKPAEVAPITE